MPPPPTQSEISLPTHSGIRRKLFHPLLVVFSDDDHDDDDDDNDASAALFADDFVLVLEADDAIDVRGLECIFRWSLAMPRDRIPSPRLERLRSSSKSSFFR